MLEYLLLSFALANKKICIYNRDLHPLCSNNSYDASFFTKNKENFISLLKSNEEIELNFYSKHKGFSFPIDSSDLSDTKVTISIMNESQPITLKYKGKSSYLYKHVEIKPNYKIILPNLIPLAVEHKQSNKNLLDVHTNSYTVPISIPLGQMTITGNYDCTPNKANIRDSQSACGNKISNLDSSDTFNCGYRCWTSSASFKYRFKGVRFAIYGTYDNAHNKFSVYLDGVLIKTINEHITPRKEYVLLFTSELLEYKEHDLEISPYQGGIFELYKIAYWPSNTAKRLNATQFRETNPNSWRSESDGIGGVRRLTESGGSASISINCRKFWFYGVTSYHLGVFQLNYNGTNVPINQYSSERHEEVLLFESPEFFGLNTLVTISIDEGILLNSFLYYEELTYPISIDTRQMNPEGDIDCYEGTSTTSNKIKNIGKYVSNHCPTTNLDSPSTYNCGYRCVSNNGNFHYTFKGVKFAIYGSFDPNYRKFNVVVDNSKTFEVNEQGSRQERVIVYVSETLEYGEHTIDILYTNTKYEIYKLAYWPTLTAKRLNSTDFIKHENFHKVTDSIGGFYEYKDDTDIKMAILPLKCTKFWLYSFKTKDKPYIDLTYNGVSKRADQSTTEEIFREDCVLVFESEEKV